MRIFQISQNNKHYNNINSSIPSFQGGGKPIDLKYIYQKHQKIIPTRVLNEVKSILESNTKDLPTLMNIHKKIYAPLLECETLELQRKCFLNLKE